MDHFVYLSVDHFVYLNMDHFVYLKVGHYVYLNVDQFVYLNVGHFVYINVDNFVYLNVGHCVYLNVDHFVYLNMDHFVYLNVDHFLYLNVGHFVYLNVDHFVYLNVDHFVYLNVDHFVYLNVDHFVFLNVDQFVYLNVDHFVYLNVGHFVYLNVDHFVYLNVGHFVYLNVDHFVYLNVEHFVYLNMDHFVYLNVDHCIVSNLTFSIFRKTNKMKVVIFLLAALIGSISGQVTTTAATRFPDIIAGLASNGHFTVFSDLLTKSGLLPQINSSTHFTIFAPTDDAFAKLSPDAFEAIKNDPAKIADLVSSHVVLTSLLRLHGTQEDIVLNSINRHQIRINTYNILHTVSANGANVTVKNIPIVHGIAHGIDTVLVAPTQSTIQIALNRTDFSTFSGLIVSANLLNFFTADKDVTLFIPNNDAFAKVPANVLTYLKSHPADLAETLKYHVVRSMTVFSIGMIHSITMTSADSHHDNLMILQAADNSLNINHAKILEKDIIATDGVIHVLDSVLIPPSVQVHIADQGIVVG
ncbi:hypothetical protein Btru_044617 [Bulinus truncatus]|nr:hypothetical protein Btru_044617 [Bulinus truncatus]